MKIVPVHEAEGMALCHDITEIVPGKVKGRAFKKGHIVRNEDITKLLLLSPFVHALLTNLAIICSDILPQSPGGVATTDVVANRKSLWKFSRNYGADHMVIHQPLCPLCSEQQGMRA
mgnify:CR=1 FL=1